MYIYSLGNKKIKEYLKLKQKKYRDSYNEFIVEGEHLVLEALKSGTLICCLVLESYEFDIDFPITFVTKDILLSLSNLTTFSPVVGICKKIEVESINKNKTLVLDGIQDPGNLGTIIRTAKAFGVDRILLSKDCVDLYNSKVIRATQGIIFHIPIIRCNILEEIKKLKDCGTVIYGTDVNNGVSLSNFKMNDNKSFCLIMGSEGSGVSSDVKKLVDFNIYIDIDKMVESLNVSIATSIILYEFTRR